MPYDFDKPVDRRNQNKVRDILTEAYEERFQKFIPCGIHFECLCQQCTQQNGADDERVAPIK